MQGPPQVGTRPEPFSRQGGFTLLELMAVVFIIGVILSFASLSVGQQSDKRLQTEAKRVHQLIKLASDEAIMQTRELAIEFKAEGYTFMGFSEGKWTPLEGDQMFRAREFDPDTRLKLEVEGELVEFDPDNAPPKVFILSSGEMTPFKILLHNEQNDALGEYTVEASYSGEVMLLKPGEENRESQWSF